MNRRSNVRNFTEGSVAPQLLSFAAPLFASKLLQIVYNMVDMIIVGQKLGKIGLSAVAVGGDVSHFLTFIAMGFSGAGQVIIAQYLGAGKKGEVSRFIGTMFSFLMPIAAVLSAVCIALRVPILRVMNTPAESFSEALGYATICTGGLIFVYGYNMVSSVLRGMGDSVRPFIFISISAVTNIFLDILFVAVLEMGAAGAALATVFCQMLSFTMASVYILRNRDRYGIEIRGREFFTIDRGMLSRLVRLGIPMAIKSAAVQMSKLFVNSWINSYGVAVSAFSGVANKLNSVTNLFSNAFTTAGSSMVGQNIGAGKYDRVRRVMLTIFAITSGIASVLTVLILTIPEKIYGIFTSDAEVIAVGMKYIPIAVLLFFGTAARSGMNAFINGSGNTKANFATAILDGIVLRIGLSVLFGLGMGLKHYGFWLGDALAGFTPLWLGMIFYLRGNWKKNGAVSGTAEEKG